MCDASRGDRGWYHNKDGPAGETVKNRRIGMSLFAIGDLHLHFQSDLGISIGKDS